MSLINGSKFPEGKVMNLVTTDANKIGECFDKLIDFLNSMITFFLGFFIIFMVTNWIIVSILIFLFILGYYVCKPLNKYISKTKKKVMEAKDNRLNLIKNLITNVTYIKIRALEQYWQARVFLLRNVEINYLMKYNVMVSL